MGRKLSIKDAAKELDLSQHFLRKSIHKGEIPFIMSGVRYVLDIEEVEEILKRSSFDNMLKNKGNSFNEYGSLRTIR